MELSGGTNPSAQQQWLASKLPWLSETTLNFRAWTGSNHFRKWGRSSGVVLLVCVGLFVAVAWIAEYHYIKGYVPGGQGPEAIRHNQFVTLLASLGWGLISLMGLAIVFGLYIHSRDVYDAEVREATLAELKRQERELRASGIATLEELYDQNQQRIDYYHTIALHQSRVSFRSGQVATLLGLLVVLILGLLAAISRDGTAAIAASVIAASAAALSGYVGMTFMKAQAAASDQLKQFFLQPVEQARSLTAERLMSQLPVADRPNATRDIIRGVVSSPIEKHEPPNGQAPQG